MEEEGHCRAHRGRTRRVEHQRHLAYIVAGRHIRQHHFASAQVARHHDRPLADQVQAIGGVALSGVLFWLDKAGVFTQPFMNRVGLVFVISLVAAIAVSLLVPPKPDTMQIRLDGVSYKTSLGFNIAAVGVVAFLILVYTIWW